MSQRNYSETGWPDFVPLPTYLPIGEAKRRAWRAFWRGIVIGGLMTGAAFVGGAAWGQGMYSCTPPDRLAIDDDGQGRAIVTYYNSVNDCSNNVDRVLTSKNGISVRVIIVIGSEADEYREIITLTPQDPNMMAIPPVGELLDGEERRFLIQGGLS
jgi:hypothetical protein